MADNDRRSLDEVLARFLDGDPEPSDGERLAEAMRGDPDFAQEVVRLLTVDDLLRQCAVPDDLAFLESLKLRLNGECGGDEFAGEFERRLRSRDERNRSGRPWLSWTVAAAACVATLVIGGLIARRPGAEPLPAQPPLQHQSVAGDSAAPVSRAPATPGGLAMVVKLDDVLWVPREGPHPSEGELVASGRLQFRSGRITLSMLTGVVLVVEGPADFELVALDKVYCRRGRIRARVPKGAEGFVVASAASAVIDLGTEFALNVEADGKSRVMVFEGLAEAALLDAAGSPKRTQLVTKSKEFELDPGKDRIAESVARPEGFVSASKMTVPTLVLDTDYAATVMKSRPRGYWRFESLSDSLVPNEVPGSPPLQVSGPVRLSDLRRGNGCAVFPSGSPEQFLGTDRLWEVVPESGYAVEFWFLSDVFSHASLVGLLPPEELVLPGQLSRYVHTFLVELTARERQSLNKPASVRFLHRWPIDTTVGSNLFSSDMYVPHRWHHVVVQMNGAWMELFFDGVPENAMPIVTDPPALSCRLVVGRRTPDTHDPINARPFVGRLDELAIYDHWLSKDEVLHHFRSATQLDFCRFGIQMWRASLVQ
ncbi:LamG-like jellyroll fold domain-containing protein [Singulisphaera acidiphila]|uniref:FecR protein n=1 Tax=Singulisphaera acidiphila (strain ATCC BAA-1392 / DSM 18658 / VKM B-2454 / MOB10) TaxID=886293 RepID=L0DF20_SINAD|nr:LamG-like jellyroll fold domain-containing protein [Singulisphaera acidiphila]AGA27445.1 FecR protein [Singulisphaera acidiphila DSM 18658]